MVKSTKKTHIFQPDIINNVLAENNTPPKSRQQINQENYWKNKERIKVQQKERNAKKKEQEQLEFNKYYQANSIRVLMSLKEYTELNKEKRKLWLDFNWTLKDTNKDIHDIVAVMKLRESAETLINDYWDTAKNETKKGQSWNSLSEEQKQRLIKYWGQEKVRKENELTTKLEEQESQGKEYEKDLELAKFHEERGKVKCECYQCQEKKQIQGEIKAEIAKESKTEKVECPECGKWVKKLDEENGICRECVRKYE